MAAEWLEWLNEAVNWVPVTSASWYVGGGFAMGMGAIGSGISKGYNCGLALDGISRQPAVHGELLHIMLIGQAISETSGIFALVVAFVLIFTSPPAACLEIAAAGLGAGIAMGMGALGSGTGTSIVGAEAAAAVGRAPHSRGRVTMTMLLGQALSTTPSVLALVVAVILVFAQQFNYFVGNHIRLAAAALSAGICAGAGAVGPGLGTGLAAAGACHGVGRTPEQNSTITRVMLVGGAVSQSTSIYAFVIAFILIFFVS